RWVVCAGLRRAPCRGVCDLLAGPCTGGCPWEASREGGCAHEVHLPELRPERLGEAGRGAALWRVSGDTETRRGLRHGTARTQDTDAPHARLVCHCKNTGAKRPCPRVFTAAQWRGSKQYTTTEMLPGVGCVTWQHQ